MVTKRTLDMGKAGDGGSFNKKRIPAGTYRGKIVKVEDHTTKAGDDSWLFTITPDSYPNRKFPHYCGFTENQLWKIRQLFTAAGFNVKKAKMAVDPTKVVGRAIGFEVDDDEYDGKEQSTIVDIFPVSELGDDEITADPDDEVEEDEDEDEAPVNKAAARKAKAAPADDEDEDELDEMDIEEID